MGGFFNFLAANAQLIFFIAVAAVPAIGALLRWVEQQREKRRILAERERLRLEALRTGRVELLQGQPKSTRSAGMPAQATSREEMAARRQREMQARLRERLEQQRRSTASQQGVPSTRSAPPSRRPAPPVRQIPSQRPPPPPMRSGQPQARPQPRPQQRPQPRPQSPQQRPQRSRPERPRQPVAKIPAAPQFLEGPLSTLPPAGGIEREEIGSSREAAQLRASGASTRMGGNLTRERLREAIVMREVLDRPLALREGTLELFD